MGKPERATQTTSAGARDLEAIRDALQDAAIRVAREERVAGRILMDDATFTRLEQEVRERVGDLAGGSELAIAWARQIDTYAAAIRARELWQRQFSLRSVLLNLGIIGALCALSIVLGKEKLATVVAIAALGLIGVRAQLVGDRRRQQGLENAPVEALAARRDVGALLKAEIADVARQLEPLAIEAPEDDVVTVGRSVRLTSRISDADQCHEVEAMRRVRSHVLRTGGAVLGIAGERGSGKSEVIRAACSSALVDGAEDQVIGVLVPAPSAIDVDAFIRLVVSKVAEQVPGFTSTSDGRHLRRVRWARGMGLLVGASGLMAGVIVATTADAPRPTPGWGWTAVAASLLILVLTMLSLLGVLRAFVSLPGAVSDRFRRDRVTVTEAFVLRITRAAAARDARALHHDVRHLETLSSNRELGLGWKGATATLGSGRSVAALPLTTSDLVHRLGALAARLDRAGYVVVIGIDELDRLEAGDGTEQFLNGVKQLFTVRPCSFLVSLSDSARSQFMRRGVDVRNVLDSSFDDVIEVEPLDLRSARSVIRLRGEERLTDLQIMFCLVLAGGLPREMLRRCRSLAEVNRKPGETVTFRRAVQSLVTEEWSDAVDGVTQLVRSWDPCAERSTLLGLLSSLREMGRSDPSLDAYVGEEWEHGAKADTAIDQLRTMRQFLDTVAIYFGATSGTRAVPMPVLGAMLAEARRAIGYDAVAGRLLLERIVPSVP